MRKFERFISSFPAGESLKGFGVYELCRGIVLLFFPAEDYFTYIALEGDDDERKTNKS